MRSLGAAPRIDLLNQQTKERIIKKQLLTTLAMTVISFATISTSVAQIATVSDNTCTEVTNNNCPGVGDHGCADAVQFTVATTGTYVLKASISPCIGTSCYACLAEAYIYNMDTGAFVTCIHSVCGATCSPFSVNVQLSSGVNYKLSACKVGCDEGAGSCTNCGTTCSATAAVN
jgi:hypothetical protein